ncbi:hypothetical protein GCM10027590_67610 [Nocardiopsis nanhaiensis]
MLPVLGTCVRLLLGMGLGVLVGLRPELLRGQLHHELTEDHSQIVLATDDAADHQSHGSQRHPDRVLLVS